MDQWAAGVELDPANQSAGGRAGAGIRGYIPPISGSRLAARRRGQGSSNREKYSKKKIRRNLSLKPVGTPVRLGFNRARKIGGKLTAPVKDRTGATIKISGRGSVEDLFCW